MKHILTMIFLFIGLKSFAQVKVVKDTVVINSTVDLNWIKINGELYQIKKTVAIKKLGNGNNKTPIGVGGSIVANGNCYILGFEQSPSLHKIQFDTKGNIIKQ